MLGRHRLARRIRQVVVMIDPRSILFPYVREEMKFQKTLSLARCLRTSIAFFTALPITKVAIRRI
jgi:hypothetical protein